MFRSSRLVTEARPIKRPLTRGGRRWPVGGAGDVTPIIPTDGASVVKLDLNRPQPTAQHRHPGESILISSSPTHGPSTVTPGKSILISSSPTHGPSVILFPRPARSASTASRRLLNRLCAPDATLYIGSALQKKKSTSKRGPFATGPARCIAPRLPAANPSPIGCKSIAPGGGSPSALANYILALQTSH
jgi:hypothetical protein